MSGGVRWVRTEAFREDMDVETEYEELRREGSLTLELVVDYSGLRKLQAEAAAAGRERYGLDDGDDEGRRRKKDEFETRIAAVVRRAAEDGLAVRVVHEDRGWVRGKPGPEQVAAGGLQAEKSGLPEPPWRERTHSLDRRTLVLDGPLPAEIAEPVKTTEASAKETYEKLRCDGKVWVSYWHGRHALMAEPATTVFFRELERLRAQDGLQVEIEQIDDHGEIWRTPGKASTKTQASDSRSPRPSR